MLTYREFKFVANAVLNDDAPPTSIKLAVSQVLCIMRAVPFGWKKKVFRELWKYIQLMAQGETELKTVSSVRVEDRPDIPREEVEDG